MTDGIAYEPTEARPGRPTCLRGDCRQYNKLEMGRSCRGCGRRTSIRPEPDLFERLGHQGRTAPVPPMPAGAPPMPLAPPRPSVGPVPSAPPAWGPPMPMPAPPPAPGLGARETLSRTVFGGFWCVIGVLGVVAAVSGLARGDVGGFLLSALVATASGCYARYIFRGGRFRILFW